MSWCGLVWSVALGVAAMPMPLIPQSHLGARPEPERKFRLLEVVRLRMRERRFSPRTQRVYVYWIRRYIVFHGRRHPNDLGAEHVRVFLSDLAVRQRVSASTQNQALAALCFLYGTLRMPLSRVQGIVPARTPRRVPVVLSKREVRQLLTELGPPLRLCA